VKFFVGEIFVGEIFVGEIFVGEMYPNHKKHIFFKGFVAQWRG
jgi:hypothetical protein